MGSSKIFLPVVTKLCAVTKLGDLTVLFSKFKLDVPEQMEEEK
jgi:hypothetical protein